MASWANTSLPSPLTGSQSVQSVFQKTSCANTQTTPLATSVAICRIQLCVLAMRPKNSSRRLIEILDQRDDFSNQYLLLRPLFVTLAFLQPPLGLELSQLPALQQFQHRQRNSIPAYMHTTTITTTRNTNCRRSRIEVRPTIANRNPNPDLDL